MMIQNNLIISKTPLVIVEALPSTFIDSSCIYLIQGQAHNVGYMWSIKNQEWQGVNADPVSMQIKSATIISQIKSFNTTPL